MPAAFKARLTVLPSIEAEAFGRIAVEFASDGLSGYRLQYRRVSGDRRPGAGLLADAAGGEEAGATGGPACASAPGPWLFEPGNATALCESLRFALSLDNGALEALRQQGIERVRREFSTRSLQLQSLTVYDHLLGTQLTEAYKTATQNSR